MGCSQNKAPKEGTMGGTRAGNVKNEIVIPFIIWQIFFLFSFLEIPIKGYHGKERENKARTLGK